MTAKTEQLQQLDNQFVHPWEDVKSIGKNKRTVITGGQGIYVTDSDGNRLIDGPAGMWCVNIGHGREEMAQAIAAQCMQLSYVSPWSLANSPAARLANKLVSIAPQGMNHVFFTTGGSTAVDSALRFLIFRNNFLGKAEKKHFISRANAYHGSTFLSSSACGKTRDKNYNDFDKEHFHFLSDPNPYRRKEGQSEDEFRQFLIDELEQKINRLGADKVAGFIAEPILASGGVIVPPKGYHQACRKICEKHDVAYISDEVVTGFGRLGHFFSSKDVFDVDADIITCAKGLTSGYVPLGAFLVSDRLLEEFIDIDKDNGIFSNGYTYSGHPVSCAAALKNIEIIENEKILEHVQEVTPHFQQRLHQFMDYPIVVDTRGMGLMGCIECEINPESKRQTKNPNETGYAVPSSNAPEMSKAGKLAIDYDLGNRIDKHCQALGLIVRPLINMCVFSPPLVITKKQIDQMFDILGKGLELTMRDLEKQGLLN